MTTNGARIAVGWTTRRGALLGVLCGLLFAFGCGGSDGQASSGSTISRQAGDMKGRSGDPDRIGFLKETRWGISRAAARSVQISAFVPYCGKPHREPYVERVARRGNPGRVVLTMLVRYPPARGACLGEGISVTRWVALDGDPRTLRLFDGSTSPPARRYLS